MAQQKSSALFCEWLELYAERIMRMKRHQKFGTITNEKTGLWTGGLITRMFWTCKSWSHKALTNSMWNMGIVKDTWQRRSDDLKRHRTLTLIFCHARQNYFTSECKRERKQLLLSSQLTDKSSGVIKWSVTECPITKKFYWNLSLCHRINCNQGNQWSIIHFCRKY